MVKISTCEKLPPVKYPPNPKFGTIFAPHVLRMTVQRDGQNDYQAEIVPYKEEPYMPGTAVLHYGQSIFEGMKAFRQQDGGVGIFRADLHAARFRQSAKRMMMAEIPEDVFIRCLETYVKFESESVPSEEGHSLYLRPLLVARDNVIKMGSSQTYTFYIMSTIAGNYFGPAGVRSARIMVNRQFVRAYPGGLGETKTASNYAAGVWPQHLAAKRECDQVLYLDAIHHDFVDELGGMNFFIVKGNQLITPKLNGCILNGVTRRSILALAKEFNLDPREEEISFTQLIRDIESGVVSEAFACGTAAVIHPIGEFLYGEKIDDEPRSIKIPSRPEKALALLERLQAVQRGIKAPEGWIFRV